MMLLSELALFLMVGVLGCEALLAPPTGTKIYENSMQLALFKYKERALEPYREKPGMPTEPTKRAQKPEPVPQPERPAQPNQQFGKQLVKMLKKSGTAINTAAKAAGKSMKEQSIVLYEPKKRAEPEIDFMKQPKEYAFLQFDKLKKYSKKTFIWSEAKPFNKVLERLQKMRPYFNQFENKLEMGMDFEQLLEIGEEYKESCGDKEFYDRLIDYRREAEYAHKGLRGYLDEALRLYQKHCDIERRFEEFYKDFVSHNSEGINYIKEKIRDSTSKKHGTNIEFSEERARRNAVEVATLILNREAGKPWEYDLVNNTCKALISFHDQTLANALIPDERLSKINNSIIREYQSLRAICAGALKQMEVQPYSIRDYYREEADYMTVY